MRNKKLWGLLLFLIVAAFLSWRFFFIKKTTLSYQSIQVTRGNLLLTVLANGIVQPQNRLEIKPPIAGRIESVLVQEGDELEKGQMLAWMSSTERASLLDAARAKGSSELAYWEDLFKPTPLIAPLSGLLIVRNVEPGQVVTAQDPILVMSDQLIIRVQVDETDIARIKIGQPAELRLEAYPEEKIQGRVDKISFESTVVNNVTVYEVDVVPEEVPDFMRSGMSAQVEFLFEKRENVLLLPLSAIKKEEKKTIVWVPNVQDSLQPLRREIQLGLQDLRQVEVLSGLNEGDTVLIPQYTGPSSASQAVSPLTPSPRKRTR